MALFEQKRQIIPQDLLRSKYGWPPFSILNTISWDWQRRKDQWETVIQDSTVGRDVKRYNATPVNTFSARGADAKEAESISAFDPYLCELMYKWFSLPGMKILDPFAGGVVRGAVASVLGRDYTGIDLSAMQVEANRQQYSDILEKYSGVDGTAEWICGDSEVALGALSQQEGRSIADMVFTCPPYYNLERYTDDSRDLSNLPTYDEFLKKYRSILSKSADMLKEDSFFVIVVSEIRAGYGDDSYYRGLVPDTISILRENFLHYYNIIILENAIGSLPIRAPKYFDKTRKIGRHHQDILVFYKGTISHIEDKFGKIAE